MKDLTDFMEVGMGQFRKADSNTSQYTTYLKPCIGVGFFDTLSKESYMLHYPDLMFYDIDKDVKTITDDFSDKSKIEVYATGGSINFKDDKGYNGSVLKDRADIEKVLKDNFPEGNVQIDWGNLNGETELYLNKPEGKFEAKKIV
ncbi:MAG: hypothetical protein PF542_04405 [Nanoarchaeota archaeon]|jgi:hypothetical protein|nr:hypothetical protein [Nanoarchaeota archaeon]